MKKIFLLLLLMLSMLFSAENTRDMVRHTPLMVHGEISLGKVKDFGKYYALLIGVENYKNLKVLETPFEDIEIIGAMLEERFGFQKPILVKDPKNSDELLGILDDMQSKLTAKDNLLIYYAGHGSYNKRIQAGHWQLKDAERNRRVGWISLDSAVNTTLRGMKAKHILVVADSCYSGALVRDSGVSLHGLDVGDQDYYQRIHGYKSRTALTSGGNEPVLDGDGNGGKNSIFAKAFIKTLQNNNKSLVSVEEIFPRLKRYVVLNADQTPEYADIKKSGIEELGGDFIFVDHQVLKVRREAQEKKSKDNIKSIVQKSKEKSADDSQVSVRLKAKLAKFQQQRVQTKENKTKEQYSLNIKPTPSDATVKIMNIRPPYKDGIKLKKGKYGIKVSKVGYKTQDFILDLTKDMTKMVKLKEISTGKVSNEDKYITIIDDKMWQDEPYTLKERRAFQNDKEYGKMLKWESANSYCKNLNLGGYDEWRLPKIQELKDLYKVKTRLSSLREFSYWAFSSNDLSDVRGQSSLNFYNGDYSDPYKNLSDVFFNYVRCVRDIDKLLQKRFTLQVDVSPSDAKVQIMNINPKYYDGIKLEKGEYKISVSKEEYETQNFTIVLREDTAKEVKLVKTSSANKDFFIVGNTMWQKNSDFITGNYNEAYNYCERLVWAGYDNWVLPKEKDFRELVEKERKQLYSILEFGGSYWLYTFLYSITFYADAITFRGLYMGPLFHVKSVNGISGHGAVCIRNEMR